MFFNSERALLLWKIIGKKCSFFMSPDAKQYSKLLQLHRVEQKPHRLQERTILENIIVKMAAAAKSGKKTNEELIAGFNALRTEQRQISNKIYELENEYHEHKIVIEALKETEPERKCFRMIGGILVEGTVKEVLPNLSANAEKMRELLESLNNKLIAKGKEVAEYKDKNPTSYMTTSGVPPKIPEEEEPVEGPTKSSGILAGTGPAT